MVCNWSVWFTFTIAGDQNATSGMPSIKNNANNSSHNKNNPYSPVGVCDSRGANAVFQPINPLAAVLNCQSQSAQNQLLEGKTVNQPSTQTKSTLTRVKIANMHVNYLRKKNN
jgi:hypothetical protein